MGKDTEQTWMKRWLIWDTVDGVLFYARKAFLVAQGQETGDVADAKCPCRTPSSSPSCANRQSHVPSQAYRAWMGLRDHHHPR